MAVSVGQLEENAVDTDCCYPSHFSVTEELVLFTAIEGASFLEAPQAEKCLCNVFSEVH